MSENMGGNEPKRGFFKDLKWEIDTIRFNFNYAHKDDWLKFDETGRNAKKHLEEVAALLSPLVNPQNLPKILEVKTGEKEYISLRRTEGPEIERVFTRISRPNKERPFQSEVFAAVPASFLEEGDILVFDVPSPTFVRCKKPEVERKVLEKLGDKIHEYGNFEYLAMMGECPELFNKDDWEPYMMQLTLVTKKAGRHYVAILGSSRHGETTDAGIVNFTRPKLSKDSKVEFLYAGYFQSKKDEEWYSDNLKKFGRMYVLMEGSTERQKRQNPKGLTQLKLTTPISEK